jgi:integrase
LGPPDQTSTPRAHVKKARTAGDRFRTFDVSRPANPLATIRSPTTMPERRFRSMHSAVYDAAGHRRSPVTMPGLHEGRVPRNKGRRYPAEPPTVEEIIAVMHTAGNSSDGARRRALIVILWRAGLRISEALDLCRDRSGLIARRGRGPRRQRRPASRSRDGSLGVVTVGAVDRQAQAALERIRPRQFAAVHAGRVACRGRGWSLAADSAGTQRPDMVADLFQCGR